MSENNSTQNIQEAYEDYVKRCKEPRSAEYWLVHFFDAIKRDGINAGWATND